MAGAGDTERLRETAGGANPRYSNREPISPEASGNLCEVLSYLLRKKSLNLKLISELKGFQKMQYLKIKNV